MMLEEMAIFAKVVEIRSFTKAAEELGIPKSTVSLRVSQLEERLGVKLLSRTTRRVTPTDAGSLYFERCQRIVLDAEEADSLLQSFQSEPKGTLKIATFPDLGYFLSEQFIPDFLLSHPQLKVDLHLMRTPKDAFSEHVDIGIQVGNIQDGSLFAKKIGVLYRKLYASASYLERKGELMNPTESLNHDFIVQSKEMNGLDRSSWELIKGREKTILETKAILTCSSLRVMRNSAMSGLGIALLPPQIFREDIRAGSLKEVLPEWKTASLEVYAVYSSKKFMSSKVRTFLENIEAQNLFPDKDN